MPAPETPPEARAGRHFSRSPATILSYGSVSGYAFWLYAFGPALALLRAELHFPYSVIGISSAIWAAGAAAAGLSFAPGCRLLGARRLLWSAAAAASGGAVFLITARSVAAIMIAAAALGYFGTLVQTTTTSVLAGEHGDGRDRALVEANVGAGAVAVAAPLALGVLQLSRLSWRSALIVRSRRRYRCGQWPDAADRRAVRHGSPVRARRAG